ncbi:hypothetical protein [Streptomyces sp. NPDC002851]
MLPDIPCPPGARQLRPPLEYLNSGFGEVRSKNGSLAAYEKQALGVESKELRALKCDPLVN